MKNKNVMIWAMILIPIALFLQIRGCKDDLVREKQTQVSQVQVKPEHNKLDAFTIAQDFIESKLKCPHTAKWPWISYSKVTVHLGNGRYQISSYLDAQNGFGALIRIHFTCVVEHISGDRWRLVKLTM